jgi:hypothetical protein
VHHATANGKIVNGMQAGDLLRLHKHPTIVGNKRVFYSGGKAAPALLCLTPYRIFPQNHIWFRKLRLLWHVIAAFDRHGFDGIFLINHSRTPLAAAIIHNSMRMLQKHVNHYLPDKTQRAANGTPRRIF